MHVVLHCMDLGDVEMCPDLLLDELVLVCMKADPRVFEASKGMVGVGLKVSVVYNIKNSASCSYDFRVSCVGNDSKEDLLHVLVLGSSPLGDERDPFLEVAKARVPGHCLETSVNLVFSIDECGGGPFDKVVLEHTLVQLMKDVGGE